MTRWKKGPHLTCHEHGPHDRKQDHSEMPEGH